MGILRKNEGITLIALVVTIIVLLILAGVTLNLIAGSDGILAKAIGAVEKNEITSLEEEINLKISEEKMAYFEKSQEEKQSQTEKEYIEAVLQQGIETSKGIVRLEGERDIKLANEIIGTYDSETGKINIIKNAVINNLKWNEAEKNLAETVNNQELMHEFMNEKTEVDYMVTNQAILTAVAESEVAMNELSGSKYASYAVVKNQNAWDIISKSSYMTEFEKKNIASPVLNDYVENLTYSSGNRDSVDPNKWAVWKVLDRNDNTQWGTESNIPLPNWIQYDLGKEYLIYKVVVVNAFQSGMGPQSGDVYFDEKHYGSYAVTQEKEPYTIENRMLGQIVKVTCDQYNWEGVQSYLSEVYVYGVEVME